MKKLIAITLCMALMLGLTGCLGTGEADTPKAAADGTPWEESWQNIGGLLGLEAPGRGF